MSRKIENTGFICEHCGQEVKPLTNGSYRNHCPFCLYSKHVDVGPGDRSDLCGGLMEPISTYYNSHKGYQIRHRCLLCGQQRVNIVARDTDQPDDFEVLLKLPYLDRSKHGAIMSSRYKLSS